MRSVTVAVIRNGRKIKTVERPVKASGGKSFVRYKGKRYPLVNNCEIHIGVKPRLPLEEAPKAAKSVPVEIAAVPTLRAEHSPTIVWDPSQKLVIEAAKTERILVDAGPGTGKTEVACARVSKLVERGVEAANIWLISFTRTAVTEIRNRIGQLVGDETIAACVHISTLDSHAWHLVQGFEAEVGHAFGTYDDTIEETLQLLREPSPELQDYLASVEHLIVDEAQDLVGLRADLVEALIEHLPGACGITVFSDDAQAIYGFAEGETYTDAQALPLPARIRDRSELAFKFASLDVVHRTESPTLLAIFTKTRQLTLSREDSSAKLRKVRADVEVHHDGKIGDILTQDLSGRSDILVLFRQRADVLSASSYLWGVGTAHRVRMSGIPICLHPWLASTLCDYEAKFLSRAEFTERYRTRVSPVTGEADAAWELLLRLARANAGNVDVTRARMRLSNNRPPSGFSNSELGSSGPILGTIHASKGREAPTVHLMLPPLPKENRDDDDEEVRVVFVGATRAKKQLLVGAGKGLFAKSLENGRAYRCVYNSKGPRAQVEIGREGDIDISRQVSRSLFVDPMDAIESQKTLSTILPGSPVRLISDPTDQYTYKLYKDAASELSLGTLSPGVNADLFTIAKCCSKPGDRRKPPGEIMFVRLVATRTVVLGADDPRLSSLHPPFSETGMFLAPVLTGFTTIPLFPRR